MRAEQVRHPALRTMQQARIFQPVMPKHNVPNNVAAKIAHVSEVARYSGLIDRTDPVPTIAYRVSDATRATGLSRSSIYLAIKSGALRVKKCGRRTLILHEDLVKFLKALP
jgi:hypothetical protein